MEGKVGEGRKRFKICIWSSKYVTQLVAGVAISIYNVTLQSSVYSRIYGIYIHACMGYLFMHV